MPARSLGFFRLLGASLLVTATLAGCSVAGTSPVFPASPVPSHDAGLCLPTDPPLPGSSTACASPAPVAPTPGTSVSTTGFYMRVWQTQALALKYTFGWLPAATISDGQFVSGLIAIPTIYPGPIYVGPVARTISDKGVATVIDEARRDGLLEGKTDYAQGIAPGSIVAHIRLVVDGVTHDLTGPIQASDSEPGAAFASFWTRVHSLDAWLAPELGKEAAYAPTAVAVMTQPVAEPQAGFTAKEVQWPLAGNFDTLGSALGSDGTRCATVTGADLTKLLPILQNANQLTRFVDSAGVKKSLQVRVLLPGEESPCG